MIILLSQRGYFFCRIVFPKFMATQLFSCFAAIGTCIAQVPSYVQIVTIGLVRRQRPTFFCSIVATLYVTLVPSYINIVLCS